MQLLFVHPNFPGQFGPVASRLALRGDVECVFVTKQARGVREGIRCIPFEPRGGATERTHHCARTFENAVWHAHAVYEACKAADDLHPDLIVGHSGFGTTVFLPELFDCPVVNLFEYYYRPHGGDMDFRPEFPPRPIDRLRARTRNAMILTDLVNCAAGYAPTRWQRDLFPDPFRARIEVIHDGIDTGFWKRRAVPRSIGEEVVDEGAKIVTYVSRGLEAMRGFDIFVRMAKKILATERNVLFVVVGEDRAHYGNDHRFVAARSFREHVLDFEQPDLTRFRFLGRVPRERLVEILSLSDLHVYLTVPFVLSWSLLDAMACECTVLASDTAPVREVLTDGVNGLLADFFDVDALARHALDVLRAPGDFHHLARAARARIEAEYDLDRTFPRMWELYRRALEARPRGTARCRGPLGAQPEA
jgi:glycosyltransferase involved in cell wall biosynthesis